MNLNVKSGDTVVVIAGKDKGSTGKVIAAYPAAGRVKVENVNIVTKHKKPRSAQVPGGIFKEAAAIDVSNVQIICPSCEKATRVRHGESEGKKVRVCCKCGASLDVKAKIEKKKKQAAKSKKKKDEKVEVEAKPDEVAEQPKKKATAKKAAKKTETKVAETETATETDEPKA